MLCLQTEDRATRFASTDFDNFFQFSSKASSSMLSHTMLLGLLLCAMLLHAARGQGEPGCETHRRLRDKWNFLDQSRKTYLRVRDASIIFRMQPHPSLRYRCVENRGNIYLLRKPQYRKGKDAVLCIGFSYIADHPRAEYSLIRLIGPGLLSHLMSPVLIDSNASVSIDHTCQLSSGGHRQYAFIRRKGPGCKFWSGLRGNWSYTYRYARQLEVQERRMNLELLNGSTVVLHCHSRYGNRYILRVRNFDGSGRDAMMCLEATPLESDPFYNFEFSRLNSGDVLGGQLRLVERGQPFLLYEDCDLLDSPARPEYLYPLE